MRSFDTFYKDGFPGLMAATPVYCYTKEEAIIIAKLLPTFYNRPKLELEVIHEFI